MARKQVFEVPCSRCDRTEHREGSADKPEFIFEAKLFADGSPGGDMHVKFSDLCSPCLKSVRALVAQIGKRIEGLSPDRKVDPKVAAEKAAAKTAAKKEQQPHNGAAVPPHANASARAAVAPRA